MNGPRDSGGMTRNNALARAGRWRCVMVRFLLVGFVAAILFPLRATDVMAQRDAGAKARGDMKGFWDPSYRRSWSRSYYYLPPRPRINRYRGFSYEPLNVNTGDTVIVTGAGVKMMKGKEVVGDIPEGLKFKVNKIVNGWLGATVERDGKKLNGWIWHGNVRVAGPAAGESPQTARNEARTRGERRFSYEPSRDGVVDQQQGILGRAFNRGYSARRNSPEGTRPRWAYPKTDPRRYRI